MDHPHAPLRPPVDLSCSSDPADRTCAAFAATLALKRLRQRWTTPILTLLLERPRRFNELQRALAPISAKVLAARLAAMRDDGLITRDERVADPPKEVVYALTPEGAAIRAALDALAAWQRRASSFAPTAAPPAVAVAGGESP